MYYNNETVVYHNGNWLPADKATSNLYNQTMHYGNGVFEGIRSYPTSSGPQLFKAKEHYERLLYSAEKMHIRVDYTVEQLTQLTYELLERNQLTAAYIRPLVHLGANMKLEPTHEVYLTLMAWKWDRFLGDSTLRLMLSSYQRPNPKSCHVHAKVTGHYINSILATTEAKNNGYDEALLLDQNGFVAEGPGANIFLEKNGKLYTPKTDNILPGITRSTVIEIAEELKIPLEEKDITTEELLKADSAFFCGTAAEIAGISSINNISFPMDWNDSIGADISRIYQQKVHGKTYNEHFIV